MIKPDHAHKAVSAHTRTASIAVVLTAVGLTAVASVMEALATVDLAVATSAVDSGAKGT